jgi:hypothetical protein
MATPEANRRAQATYRQKLKDAGGVKITFLMEAGEKEKLDKLAKDHGSIPKAISFLLKSAG